MPVILAEEHHEAWLSNQAGKEVLVPFPADVTALADAEFVHLPARELH
jgi:putative SOS response-associated peptidase YedK